MGRSGCGAAISAATPHGGGSRQALPGGQGTASEILPRAVFLSGGSLPFIYSADVR